MFCGFCDVKKISVRTVQEKSVSTSNLVVQTISAMRCDLFVCLLQLIKDWKIWCIDSRQKNYAASYIVRGEDLQWTWTSSRVRASSHWLLFLIKANSSYTFGELSFTIVNWLQDLMFRDPKKCIVCLQPEDTFSISSQQVLNPFKRLIISEIWIW